MEFYIYLISTVASLVFVIWLYIKNKFAYWQNRGVPYIEPTIPFGNIKGVGKTLHLKDFMSKTYNQYKRTVPFIGAYFLSDPVAIILDLDLIKTILIKDFAQFSDRKLYYDGKTEPISAHMFNLHGEKWKIARQKLSPTFTSGRLKHMFPMITEVADRFTEMLDPIVGDRSVIEIKELLLRFTTDISGTVIFGIECNSLKIPNTEFRLKGHRVFDHPRHGELMRIFMESYPEVARFFKMKLFPDDVSEFFMNVIRDTIDYREKNDVHRNDLMDLLIQLKNTGTLEGHNGQIGKLTEEEIAAQAFIFFIGGFETSATLIGFTLYALALRQDIQDKVRDEIADVLEKHDGKFTYDAMKSMKYLHQVVNESLRMYSPASYIVRKAGENYPVPNTKFLFEKDTVVVIPVSAIHHDADFYPNPEEFNPENFSSEAIGNRHTLSFLPFGDGPRNCIGLRLAKNITYVGLISLLKNYRFKPSSKTPIPMEYAPDVQILRTKTDFYFELEKL